MIRLINILILFVICAVSYGNLFSQDSHIIQKIAGTNNDYGRSIGVDSLGNVYVLGDFSSSTLTLNNGISLSSDGSGDLFLAKYNSNGVCQWAQKIAGSGADVASNVVVDKYGNSYFTGYSSSSNVSFNNGQSITNSGSNDAFVAKYNTDGLCQWAQKIAGSNSDYAYGVDLDANQNVYVSGNFSSSIISFNNGISLSNSGSLDIFIAKYNSAGLCQWAQKIYGSSAEYSYSLAVDKNNDIFVTGYYSSSTLNFNNGVTLSNSGSSDIFVTKYSTNGSCYWAKRIYGSAVDESYSIDTDSKGNAYLSGSFTSPTLTFESFTTINNFAQRDIYVTKIDNNGNFKWANRIYGNSNDFGKYIHLDNKDNVWLAGYYTSDSLIFSSTLKLQEVQGTDAYVAKIDTNGNVLKIKRIFGNVSDYIEGITNNSKDSIFIVGYFNSSKLYVNSDSLTQSGLNDVFFTTADGGSGGGGGGGDDDTTTFAKIIAPLNNQIGVSVRPVFESSSDKPFKLYLAKDSAFTDDVDTLISTGKYLILPYNLKYNTTYYARSLDTIKFTTEVIKKDQLWNWRNSYPQGNDLNIIKYFSADSIMAMGELMTIINSTNGGTLWKVRRTGVSNYFNSAFFSPFDGTIYGTGDYGTIYKSTDRGENWDDINLNTSSNIHSIALADKNAGWCVGSKGSIFKTTNGGNSWLPQNSNITHNLNGVAFPNLNVGYAVGDSGAIVKTTNGGSVWTKLSSITTSKLLGVTFLNLTKGFVYGDNGNLHRTTNGGTSWTKVELFTSETIRDLKFVNTTTGFAIGDSGIVYKTSDGGTNWSKKNTSNISNLYSMSFLNSQTGIICGEKGLLLKTVNGGENWTNLLVDKLGEISLKSISFVNENEGYIDLSPDTLYLKSTNGGESWFKQSIGQKVNKVFFINQNHGWAVGDSGRILKTTNGGLNWSLKPSNTTVNLVNLSFIDSLVGWCAGDNGYLLITDDGGNSWLSQNVGSDNNYLQVIFTDSNNGWVITDGAEILKTTNGGSDWNFQINPKDSSLSKLFFLNNLYGWGVYGDNNIIKTTDGGQNWDLVNTGYTNISDIFFVDNFNGWATGDIIIYTSDGGLTWYQQGTVTKNKINGLYFKNYNHGWGVGENGTILEFDNTDFVILPPELITPSNNADNLSLTPLFDWNEPDKATYYKVQISMNGNFTNIIYEDTVSQSTFKLNLNNKLVTNTIYYWRVKAFNSTDSSFWSANYYFKTQTILSKPTLLTPNNGQLETFHKPQFSWTAVQLADQYHYQLSTSITFDVVNTFTDTVDTESYIPENYLAQVTNFFWRVKAVNEANESDWSNTFEFTTDTVAVPGIPILVSPANNSINVAKVGSIIWNKAPHSVRYRIQIAKDVNFTTLIEDDDDLNDTTYNYNNLVIATKYYFRVKAYNWLGDESNWSQVRNFTTLTFELIPEEWAVTDDTGNDATILIQTSINPKIDNRNIAIGDAIGVFYTDGSELKCAGYGVWNNQNLAITIWGDNTESTVKDGFADGEKYFLKIWDGQKGTEIYAQFTITSGPDTYSKDAFTVLGSLKGITPSYNQNYIKSGWNLISSYIKPENEQLEAVFKNIESKVVIVKNKSGQTYIPAYGINTIGKWNYKQAYQIFMSSADTLKIKGISLVPENETISMTLGWQMVGYLKNSNNNVINSLATLTATNSLLICKNSIGQVYIPQYNVNSIGDMIVGQGYNMYITNPPGNLTYPANPPAKANSDKLTPLPIHLLPSNINTGNYSVMLMEIDASNFDEIGVYNNNNILIGSGVVYNNLATVIIWGDDTQTEIIDGATENEKINFKLYNIKNGVFSNLEISNLTDLVSSNYYYEANYIQNSIMKSQANIADSKEDIIIYPIPAKEKITIQSSQSIDKIQIINSEGRIVLESESPKTYGDKRVELNIENLPNGEYIIKLVNGNDIDSRKFMIVK